MAPEKSWGERCDRPLQVPGEEEEEEEEEEDGRMTSGAGRWG